MDTKKILAKVKIGLTKAIKESMLFLSSPLFLKNLGFLVAFFLGIWLLTFGWLHCYTNHGHSLQVHDYVGMDIDEAKKLARAESFRVVIRDSIYDKSATPNTVLNQNPKPFSKVKKRRKIYLQVAKNKAPLTSLPPLRGGNDDLDQYRKKVTGKDIKVGIKDKQYSNEYEPNTILEIWHEGRNISHKINSGYQLRRGSTIEVVITTNEGASVTIPELVCQTLDAAKFLIESYQLSIGSVIEDGTIYDPENAYVYKQEPSFSNRNVPTGTEVKVFITQDRPSGCPANSDPLPQEEMDWEEEEF